MLTAKLQYLHLNTQKCCLMREKSQIKMAAKTQISPAFIHVSDVKKYDSLQPMRSLAAADWLSMFAAERI